MNFLPMTYAGDTFDVFFEVDKDLRVSSMEVRRDGKPVELERGDIVHFHNGISSELILSMIEYESMRKSGAIALV
jgi:hypothetical protein